MRSRKLWIRVDADTPRDPNIVSLALSLGTSPGQMLGHCVCVWLAVAEHCADGDMSLVTPGTIEHWAQWTGAEGFGAAFLSTFVQDGVLQAFRDRNAKLAEQREKEREKKRKQRAGQQGDNKGTGAKSPPTVRNGTKENPPTPFDAVWAAYPKRAGSNSRAEAERAFDARIADGSLTPEAALDAVRRYAAWCEATGKVGTEVVMQAASFFGPMKRGYAESWEVPTAPAAPSRAEMLRKQGYFVPDIEGVA